MTAAVAQRKPFFRADQVGSLLRPAAVLDARERFARGAMDAAALRAIEDASIREVVAQQERVGLPVVTDGEFRRENWYADFIGGLQGVEIRAAQANPAFKDDPDHEITYVPKNVVTVAKLDRPEPLLVRDYAYLASVALRPAKITIPSPSRLHFHGGRSVVSVDAYPDIEAFFADVVRVYRAEIAALEAAGCRYIQIDDPLFSYFISERMRAEIVATAPPAQRFAGRSGAANLLVLGGSQGAQRLNRLLPEALAQLPPAARPQVRHQAGSRNLEATQAAYASAGVAAEVLPFIDDMAAAYAWADFAICRAGAMTICVLQAVGLGAVLVPFPAAVDDHQTRNAESMVQLGAALLVQERDLDAPRLAGMIAELAPDRPRLLRMAEAARGAVQHDAAATLAGLCMAAGEAA